MVGRPAEEFSSGTFDCRPSVSGGDRIAPSAAEWRADGIVYQVSQTSFLVATAQNTNQQPFITANLTTPQTTLIAGDDYYFS